MDNFFNTIEEVIEDIKQGKPIIIVDDYDTHNNWLLVQQRESDIRNINSYG